jgi:hypothetical protein
MPVGSGSSPAIVCPDGEHDRPGRQAAGLRRRRLDLGRRALLVERRALRIKRRAFRPPIAVALLVIAFVALAGFVVYKIPQPPPPPYGVSNMKIDSSTQFEFDYRRSTACKDLTFEYVFFDQPGQQVDRYADEKHNAVLGDVTNHFTIYSFTPLDPRGVRFDATPTCHA